MLSPKQPQMPCPLQFPEQQFAFTEQSWPTGLQFAHSPPTQTPLQHWVPCWQFPPGSVQAHVPALQTPLQHCSDAQLELFSAHEPEPPVPPVPPDPPLPPEPPEPPEPPLHSPSELQVCRAAHALQ